MATSGSVSSITAPCERKACHLLFEQGFLSHDCIRSMDCDTMKNITKGYEYFSSWLSSILDEGMYTNDGPNHKHV